MKKNKTILSLKEVRKRSKKFYFKLKEHVPLINPCSDVISGIVVKEFKPKLINRIDDIIVFHKLSDDNVKAIIDIMLKEVAKRLEKQEIKMLEYESR